MTIRDVLTEYLADQGWTTDERDRFIAAPVTGASDEWLLIFFMPAGAEQLIVYSVLPITVAPEHMDNVSTFMTLANFGLAIGNFELDLTDVPGFGEARYKTSVDFTGYQVEPVMIENLIDANVAAVDRYLSALQEAAAGRPADECNAEVDDAAAADSSHTSPASQQSMR